MSTAAAPAAAVIDPFERFPPGQRRADAVLDRRRLLGVPGRDRRPRHRPAEPDRAGGPCRLPAAARHAARRRLPRRRPPRHRPCLGDRGRGRRGRRLPVDRVRAADPARRRLVALRHRHRPRLARRRPHRRLGDDGPVARHHLRPRARLLPLGPAPAVALRPPRLRPRAGRRPHGVRHRGHLRDSCLRLSHLHLPLHPVRQLPRARRHDPLFSDVALAAVGHRLGGPARSPSSPRR